MIRAQGSYRASPIVLFGAVALVLGVLVCVLSAETKQPAKVFRIGFLGASADAAPLRGLREGLRELGYLQDRNIIFEYRFAQEKNERLPALAAELVRSKVDVIVTHASSATRAAKQATSTIPIVMVSVGDPVGTGFVASLARPGGNVTGLSNNDAGLAAKRLALLKEVLPKLSRAAALRNPANPTADAQSKETESAARSLAIEVQPVDVRDPKELEAAFSVMVKARASAVTVMGDPLFLSERQRIADLALTMRLPSVFARSENVEAGGLMSYGTSLTELFRQAATYVDKILKGAKPGDLPVQEPTRMYLVINRKTATALGFTVPQELLLRADHLIE